MVPFASAKGALKPLTTVCRLLGLEIGGDPGESPVIIDTESSSTPHGHDQVSQAMEALIGIFVFVLGLVCWVGQTLVVFAPDVAVKLGVNEAEGTIDKSMYLFERYSQGIMDVALTWLLPASAIMMLLDYTYWPIFALLGAGVYLYFPGVFSITRIVLKKNGMAVGSRTSENLAYALGTLWTLSALLMIALATAERSTAR